MCGICGFTGKKDEVILKKMTDSLFHRGPDEEGFYFDDKINLGIRRLSIIDLETGHQPIHNEDKTIWMVFNGEIYNFQELRKDLEKIGHNFYTHHSDGEVLVHLYEEYGIDFLSKLNGMFSIALWDKKNEKLILVRDRMGVKPLFYCFIQNILIFASEIKAILLHPLCNLEADYTAISYYFTFKNIPSPFTAFKNIYSLRPAEYLIFFKGKITKHKWWKIDFSKQLYNNDEEFIKKNIIYLLEDAVRLRMICDVPFGAYLSGGIDSSSVVSLMSRYSSKPIKTFSLGYEDELKNKEADLYYARKISKIYHTEHYEYIMSYKELINDIEDVLTAFDQPFSGTISTYFLTKLIRKHVKVALSGDGSDELFGSYLSHRLAQPMYHFKRLKAKIKKNRLSPQEKLLFSGFQNDFLKGLYEKSKGKDYLWRSLLYVFLDEEKEKLFSEKFKHEIKEIDTLKIIKNHFQDLTAKDPLNRILEFEWNTQFPDQVLAFVDFLSMAHSVEIRSPFLDWRLVEFVATIPGELKIKNGIVKYILKQALVPLLPEEIINRPKEGFVLPIFDWMTDKLKDYILSVLSKDRLHKHNLFNEEFVFDLIEDYYSGNHKNSAKIWNLVCFQVWWEKYF